MNSTSLSELTNKIQSVIRQNFTDAIWVRAEISELRENGGHCYLELIEKDSETDNILAKTRATCWANVYRMLKPYFESNTGETLRAGLNVLVAVTVEFNGVYGFSLNIRDIDPTYTIGELAARRMQIIQKLREEGIDDMNKQLPFPTLPQRIAIISSETAAGYGDFCNQLNSDTSHFAFYPRLFPAIMQGNMAETSIIGALEKIYKHVELFDVVVIIRGGGATTDLSCFDSYNLAINCAQFPLPIIAGIGHQRDVSILDMVAHTSVKTPTAAAEYLISALEKAEEEIDELASELCNFTSNIIQKEHKSLELYMLKIKQASKTGFLKEQNRLSNYLFQLKSMYRNRIHRETNKLALIATRIETQSPKYLYERGYTITTVHGKRITSALQVKPGDKVTTHLADGHFDSEVVPLL
jgi:exodeoxyribonuclease VII large subunit